jgi:hypothetical protein
VPERRPSFESAKFRELVNTAGAEITDSIKRSASIVHHATAGPMREGGFRSFLGRLLSEKYFVGTGFAFDAHDQESHQLDIVIAQQPPFGRTFEKDYVCKLPCEVVLAAIEVKKTLNSMELKKSLINASSLRALTPYGNHRFISGRPGGAKVQRNEHRCFYGVIALESDLSRIDWAQRDWARLKRIAAALGEPPDLIDRLVILDRGIINVSEGRALSSDGTIEPSMFEWFVHLANHLDRESGRRPKLDIDIYTGRRREWKTLP